MRRIRDETLLRVHQPFEACRGGVELFRQPTKFRRAARDLRPGVQVAPADASGRLGETFDGDRDLRARRRLTKKAMRRPTKPMQISAHQPRSIRAST